MRIVEVKIRADVVVGWEGKTRPRASAGHDFEEGRLSISISLEFAIGLVLDNTTPEHALVAVVGGHGQIEGDVGEGVWNPTRVGTLTLNMNPASPA